jgi:hypothetical protein
MEVSSVKQPAGREKLKFGSRSVTRGNVPRALNSTGPPRASQIARPKREPRIRHERDGVDIFGLLSSIDNGPSAELIRRMLAIDVLDYLYREPSRGCARGKIN